MIMTHEGPGMVRVLDPAVEAKLDLLPKTGIADLRIQYRELFRAEPPKAFGPDLLRRSIAGAGIWGTVARASALARPIGARRHDEAEWSA
jgi:hypothetical protein